MYSDSLNFLEPSFIALLSSVSLCSQLVLIAKLAMGVVQKVEVLTLSLLDNL